MAKKSETSNATPDESPKPADRIMPPLETPRGFFSSHKLVTFALVILLVGAAAAGTYYYQSGQWDKSLTNQPAVVHQEKVVDPTANWQTYSNSQYQFSVKSPIAITPLGQTNKGTVTHNGATYNFEQLTSVPLSFAVIKSWVNPTIDPFQQDQTSHMVTVAGINWYATYNPKGGVPQCDDSDFLTTLPDNSGVLMVSYLDENVCPGDATNSKSSDMLKTILATFKFTNQAQASTQQTQTSGQDQTYVAKNFTLTMQVPAGYDVKEDTTSIIVSPSPYKVDELGMDNAFFKLTKYDATHTKDSELAAYKKNIKNVQQSTQTVDGLSFTVLTGDDWGRFGGDSAGKVKVVFFNLSWLEMIQMPQGNQQTYDPLAVGEQILDSFKFSK